MTVRPQGKRERSIVVSTDGEDTRPDQPKPTRGIQLVYPRVVDRRCTVPHIGVRRPRGAFRRTHRLNCVFWASSAAVVLVDLPIFQTVCDDTLRETAAAVNRPRGSLLVWCPCCVRIAKAVAREDGSAFFEAD